MLFHGSRDFAQPLKHRPRRCASGESQRRMAAGRERFVEALNHVCGAPLRGGCRIGICLPLEPHASPPGEPGRHRQGFLEDCVRAGNAEFAPQQLSFTQAWPAVQPFSESTSISAKTSSARLDGYGVHYPTSARFPRFRRPAPQPVQTEPRRLRSGAGDHPGRQVICRRRRPIAERAAPRCAARPGPTRAGQGPRRSRPRSPASV